MRYFLIFIIASSVSLKAQDSPVPKKGFRLFDFQFGLGSGSCSSPSLTKENLGQYTRHKEYVSEEFTANYSDQSRNYYGPRRRHPQLKLNISPDAEVGLNATFQIHDCSFKLLNRLKPRIGINYYRARLFQYKLGLYGVSKKDTFFYADPSYPPLVIDSVMSGTLLYTYSIARVSGEMGLNFDFIQRKHLILYGGFVFGYGVGNARFSVSKHDDASWIDKRFEEGPNYTSRFTFPVGILLRAGQRHKKNVNFFTEIRPGYFRFKTTDGADFTGAIFTFNVGMRLSFHPNR